MCGNVKKEMEQLKTKISQEEKEKPIGIFRTNWDLKKMED